MVRAPASEFPNDNPLLHAGAVWVCAEPCGMPSLLVESVAAAGAPVVEACVAPGVEERIGPAVEECVARPAEDRIEAEPAVDRPSCDLDASGDDANEDPLVAAIVEEPAAETDPHDADPPARTIEPPPPDPFDELVQSLVNVAIAQGSASAAAALPDLLDDRLVPSHALDPDAVDALVASGFAVRTDGGLRASERLRSLVSAWAGVLRRTGDFSGCGATMLHEWSADLVAAALGAPGRAQQLQYELRRRGVAAFGLVRPAA